jgi:hypothetical protein
MGSASKDSANHRSKMFEKIHYAMAGVSRG